MILLYTPHHCHCLSKIQIQSFLPLPKISQLLPSTYKAKSTPRRGHYGPCRHIQSHSLLLLSWTLCQQSVTEVYGSQCSLLSPFISSYCLAHKFSLSFQVQLTIPFPSTKPFTFSAVCAIIKLFLTPCLNCLPLSLTKLHPAPNLVSEHHWFSISICSIKQYVLIANILLLTSIRKIHCTLKAPKAEGPSRHSVTQLQGLGQWSETGDTPGVSKLGSSSQIQPTACFSNKILIESSHTHLSQYCLWLLLPYNSKSWVVPTETIWAEKPKIFTIWPLKRNATGITSRCGEGKENITTGYM